MQQLKILNIYNLYTYRVAIEVHKFKYRKEELNRPQHNHYYTPVTQVHSHNTRHSRNGSQMNYSTRQVIAFIHSYWGLYRVVDISAFCSVWLTVRKICAATL